jgi:hypothetical protein
MTSQQGFAITGFLDDDPALVLPDRWRFRGRFADLEAVLQSDVIDEVTISLPFLRWDLVAPVIGVAEEHGKIVRVPMDVLDRASTSGTVEELDGTPVFSLVSRPDRMLGLSAKRLINPVGRAALLVVLSPLVAAVAIAIRLRERAARALPPHAGGALRAHALLPQVPDDCRRRGGPLRGCRGALGPPRLQARRRPSRDAAWRLPPPDQPRRAAAAVERAPGQDEPGRPAPGPAARGGRLRRLAPPAPLHEARHHRSRASERPRDGDFDHRASLDLDCIDRWSTWMNVKIMTRTIPAAQEGR